MIDAATLHWLLDRHPSRARVHEAVARRKLLPIGIAEHLRAAAIERPRPAGDARAAASCDRAAV